MKRILIDSLRRRFGRTLDEGEIEQQILLAELRAELGGLSREEALTFVVARRALAKQERSVLRWQQRHSSVMLPFLSCDDRVFEEWVQHEEWQHMLSTLPYPARKLAEIAQEESEAYHLVYGSALCANRLSILRGRIKNRWVAWERNHSVGAYYRFRKILIAMLRRHYKSTCGRSCNGDVKP